MAPDTIKKIDRLIAKHVIRAHLLPLSIQRIRQQEKTSCRWHSSR